MLNHAFHVEYCLLIVSDRVSHHLPYFLLFLKHFLLRSDQKNLFCKPPSPGCRRWGFVFGCMPLGQARCSVFVVPKSRSRHIGKALPHSCNESLQAKESVSESRNKLIPSEKVMFTIHYVHYVNRMRNAHPFGRIPTALDSRP